MTAVTVIQVAWILALPEDRRAVLVVTFAVPPDDQRVAP